MRSEIFHRGLNQALTQGTELLLASPSRPTTEVTLLKQRRVIATILLVMFSASCSASAIPEETWMPTCLSKLDGQEFVSTGQFPFGALTLEETCQGLRENLLGRNCSETQAYIVLDKLASGELEALPYVYDSKCSPANY